MKEIIFGNGYLASRLKEELKYETVTRSQVDTTDLSKVRRFLDLTKPSVVINAIGLTGGPGAKGIDYCELHKEETIASNITSAINIASECSLRGIYFVHFGSGCIYNGYEKAWTEIDPPNFYGLQFYAKTKIDAERLLNLLPNPGLILRIRMPIDNRSHPRNLVNKLLNYSRVIDAQNSMTTVPHMIKVINYLVDERVKGIVNFTNPGTTSAAEIMGLYNKIVMPHSFGIMSLKELDSETIGKRSNCRLDTTKLENILPPAIKIPEIHNAVEECLARYK
ncbi:MAG TPA: sugar nucleotide-binding protein [Candidatus Nanoarchaeia archaeon]|nr:sugar nucleotide-binding protein [Candidatus Nanoarchaeia archaeon]